MNKLVLGFVALSLFSSLIYAYSSYTHSVDGTDVACGGEYSSYAHFVDGGSVCAGWESN